MRTKLLMATSLAALVLGGFTPSARAVGVVFDPDGTGLVSPISGVIGFDEAVGNALAVGAAPLTPASTGTSFTLLYQAVIAAYNVTAGQQAPFGIDTLADGTFNAPAFPGAPVYELTVVARIQEMVTSVTGATGTAGATVTFALAPDQTGSYLKFFYDQPGGSTQAPIESTAPAAVNGQAASNSAGTGFAGGTLIYEAVPDPTLTNASNFTLSTVTPIGNFNDSGSGTYGGIMSVLGSGATSFLANSLFVNTAFFPGGIAELARVSFNTTQKTPFDTTAPSLGFVSGAGLPGAEVFTAVTPVYGATNGVSGPDFGFQADANNSLNPAVAVPEPATLVMGLTGLGLASLARLRSSRRRSKAAVA